MFAVLKAEATNVSKRDNNNNKNKKHASNAVRNIQLKAIVRPNKTWGSIIKSRNGCLCCKKRKYVKV